MTRSSFRSNSIKTCEIFQMIHIDFWGPMKHPTRKNRNSFITIVDDFSRYTWILLKKKKK